MHGVDLILGELCDTIVRDQKDGDLFGCKEVSPSEDEILKIEKLEWEDIVEEQSMVSRLIHLVKSTDGDANLEFKVSFSVFHSKVAFSRSSTFRPGRGG